MRWTRDALIERLKRGGDAVVRSADDGSYVLIGKIETPSGQRWLNEVFGPISLTDAARLEQAMPLYGASRARELHDAFNGFVLFGSLYLLGARSRSGLAPWEMDVANGRGKPRHLPGDRLIIGGCSQGHGYHALEFADRSVSTYDAQGQWLAKWPTVDLWIAEELDRLERAFEAGRLQV